MELGRLDGKTFNRAIVKHVLPGPGFNLDQLNSLFASNGLTQTDMIALSGKLLPSCLKISIDVEKFYMVDTSRSEKASGYCFVNVEATIAWLPVTHRN